MKTVQTGGRLSAAIRTSRPFHSAPVAQISMLHRIVLTLLIALVAAGCSDQQETYVVHGMVVYPDGKPLTKGTVEFEAVDEKRPITASSEIEPDGTFQLGTFARHDGAIPGRQRIAVIADAEIGTEAERPEFLPPPVVASRFSEFKTSGLETVVEPRMNNVLIEVDYFDAERENADGLDPASDPGYGTFEPTGF